MQSEQSQAEEDENMGEENSRRCSFCDGGPSDYSSQGGDTSSSETPHDQV